MVVRPNLQDTVVALVLAVWALAEVALGHLDGPVDVIVVAAVLTTVPLAWRRSFPVAAGFISAGGIALKTAFGAPNEGLALNVALLLAAYSIGRHRSVRTTAMAVPAMIVLAWVSLFGLPDVDQSFSNYPFIAVWLGAPAAAGAALRFQLARTATLADRAARAELHREEHARQAVQSERGRIARELHDTVAHAVSVMVLHTGAVRSRLPPEFASEKDALSQAEASGRQAISELRRLLAILRSDVGLADIEPQPTLAQLEQLLDDTRSDGLVVDVRIDGQQRPLDPALEVSAYRILQEALTNVRKHARAREVCVRLAYEDDCVRLHVADDGIGSAGAAGGPDSFGLVGIRERVEVYGGTLAVSSPEAGGFALDAALPVRTP